MSRRPILTAEHLRDAGACPEQVALFRRTFPDGGAALTLDNLHRARAAGLDVGWYEVLLDQPTLAEYDRARASAWAEFFRATEPARVKYSAEYSRDRASAWTEFCRAIAPARAERDRAFDRALLAGLIATFNRRQQERRAA